MGGEANDGLVAAGQEVGVVVTQGVGLNHHGAAGLDEGWSAGIKVEDVLLGGFGGIAVFLVVADIVGAAAHVNEGCVWVGVVVPGDEADAVVGAGAVAGVVGEAVIAGGVGDGDVLLGGVQPNEGAVIGCGGGTVVGVGLFVLTVGVVEDDAVAGAGGEVHAAAFGLAGIEAATGIEVGAGLGGEADDGAVDLLAIGGDVGVVFDDVGGVEVIDVVGVVVAGESEVA
ncbi:hypothetical protein ADT28_09280 [Xylella fastidiosa]|nr:hypothetical protein OY18_07015 [Xylella fastidiosa]ALR02610.1 hypothetical protein OY18_10835 [Xylella fastidiosa]ALR02934.1 hypothetical protein OY18_12835 [Xylella fastidiosa]KXB11339.1 hypothetical protein ADT29_12270 [Xylella fastidiosa]KXB19826.1 hypothetical protein ADT28_09280 [Xylella fastidiosa]